jgi:hypothetical protein
MTAFAEPCRVRPKSEDEPIKDFQPPVCKPGWFIHFYVDADKGTTPHNGICKAVSGMCITADVYENGRTVNRINIRHINDPRAQSPTMKRWGGWDFVDTREMQAIRELTARIEALENRTEPASAPAPRKTRRNNDAVE